MKPQGKEIYCRQCQTWQPQQEFTARQHKGQTRYYSPCHSCDAARGRAARAQARAEREAHQPVIPEGHKECCDCREYKPLAAMMPYRNGGAVKYRGQCRDCYNARLRAKTAARHPEQTEQRQNIRVTRQVLRDLRQQQRLEYIDRRWRQCRLCHQRLPWEAFYRNHQRGRPSSSCKSCTIAESRAHIIANRAHYNALNTVARKRWRDEHRDEWRVQHRAAKHARRAKLRNSEGRYTSKQWAALKKRYNYRCLACGKVEPEIQLTVDHIVPLILGGANNIGNIQPLCHRCNSRKGDTVVDYRVEGETKRTRQRKPNPHQLTLLDMGPADGRAEAAALVGKGET